MRPRATRRSIRRRQASKLISSFLTAAEAINDRLRIYPQVTQRFHMRAYHPAMKFLAVALAVLTSALYAEPEGATASLKRFEELGKKSEAITKEASERDVALILGEPQSKGTGAWSHPERKVWHYLSYTDDALHRSFSVWFDPKTGCSLSKVAVSRAEIEKLPLRVSTGKVIHVYPDYPSKGGDGFLCDVQFHRDGRDIGIGVAVATSKRVNGRPEIGATIRVEYRGQESDTIFVGERSLYLESMVFTGNGEKSAPANGDKPSFKAEAKAPTAKAQSVLYEDSQYKFVGHGYGNQGKDTPSFFAFSKATGKWVRISEVSLRDAVLGRSPDFHKVNLAIGWDHSVFKGRDFIEFPLITGAVLLPNKIEFDPYKQVYQLSIGSSYGEHSHPTVFHLRKSELDACFQEK